MNHNKSIHYKQCYVAFLDILGFESLVKSGSPESKAKIEEYFDLVNKEVERLKEVSSKRNIGTLIISDSVILSIEITKDKYEDIEILRQLCIAVRDIQHSLALINVWLRGGISSGEAFFSSSQSQIVGPAYIDAYNIEQRAAIYPRVVVDAKIINELKCDSSDSLISEVNDQHAKFQDYKVKDRNILFQWNKSGYETVGMKKDVALFVDYLSLSYVGSNHLPKIVDNISCNLYGDNHVYKKFRWVIEYLMARSIPLNQFQSLEENKVINEQFNRLRCL